MIGFEGKPLMEFELIKFQTTNSILRNDVQIINNKEEENFNKIADSFFLIE